MMLKKTLQWTWLCSPKRLDSSKGQKPGKLNLMMMVDRFEPRRTQVGMTLSYCVTCGSFLDSQKLLLYPTCTVPALVLERLWLDVT
jgi:hypothetical protein